MTLWTPQRLTKSNFSSLGFSSNLFKQCNHPQNSSKSAYVNAAVFCHQSCQTRNLRGVLQSPVEAKGWFQTIEHLQSSLRPVVLGTIFQSNILLKKSNYPSFKNGVMFTCVEIVLKLSITSPNTCGGVGSKLSSNIDYVANLRASKPSSRLHLILHFHFKNCITHKNVCILTVPNES